MYDTAGLAKALAKAKAHELAAGQTAVMAVIVAFQTRRD